MAAPLISVIVPVYNAATYVQEALESILNQSMSDLELIVIDDGSKDSSASVIERIRDPRLILHQQSNSGMAAALNHGISIAKGEFIARQDADDISLPGRLKKQLSFLQNHPETGLLGTHARIVDKDGKPTGGVLKHVTENDLLRATLYFDNPFVHSSVLIRRNVLDKTGYYNTALHPLLQDFDLWFRVSQVTRVANIPEVLQEYRQLPSGISQSSINFSSLVADQCLQHLRTLSDNASLKDFAYFYHACFTECGTMNGAQALAVLKELESAFLKKEHLAGDDSKAFAPIYKHFKKIALDHAVFQHKDHYLSKLFHQVRRKLLRPTD